MLEIYIARHGQTEWNQEGRLQGWLNSPLTSKGIESAKHLGKKLDAVRFDAFYSSPSPRAYETLEIAINKPKEHFYLDERLKEIGLGAWQGKLIDEIKKEYTTAYHDYYHNPEVFTLDGAENYFDLKMRVSHFLKEVTEMHFTKDQKKKVLVVTHGVTLMMMRLLFNEGQIKDLSAYGVADNAKLHVYQYDGSKYQPVLEEV